MPTPAAPTPAGPSEIPPSTPKRSGWRRFRVLLIGLAMWGVAAYILAPEIWKTYYRHDKAADATTETDGEPTLTTTSDGHPGDPVNLCLVGSEHDLVLAMTAAGWYPADPITFESSVRIAVDSVIRRPDTDAPVSSLFLFGRKQDLAFELPVGDSPRQRHHVRFWRADREIEGRPMWLGSATFDERVGLSYTTGQVTHHIGPDVDAERDRILDGCEKAGWVETVRWIDGFQPKPEGRNGGGDEWRTDGRLALIVLRDRPGKPTDEAPPPLPLPPKEAAAR